MALKSKDFKEGEIILFLVSAQKYLHVNLEILKEYVNKQKKYCVYITVNRSYNSLMEIFKKEKISTDRLFIIDAVTPVGTTMKRVENAVFVGSPRGLTNISIAATSAIQSMPKGNRLLFLDTVSTLIIYNNVGTVTKFAHFLITKMREWGAGGAVISLEKETDKGLVNQLSPFCDRVVNIK